MSIIGNIFAICIILTVSIVFFQIKHYITLSSKYFAAALLVTSIYCFTAITLVDMDAYMTVHPLIMHIVGFLEGCFLLTASTITALYVILKLTEHTFNQDYHPEAKRIFIAAFMVYVTLLITNIFTGWIFTVEPDGGYIPGPIANIEYLFITFHIAVVVYCAIKNARTVSKSARLASWQSLMTAIICIGLRLMFPKISFLALAMALLLMVFFLNFQSHRLGVNTLTSLNDKRRFFAEIESRLELGNKFNVYIIRIQNYDVLNSVYGHRTGDEVLYLFAFALEKLFNEGVAFHIHSTTFGLVLPFSEDEEKYTQKLLKLVEEEIVCSNYHIKLKCSVVSRTVSEPTDIDIATFYEQLTHTLHKVQKMDQVYLKYTPEHGVDMRREKHVINRLQNIDREHGYEVWYQPIWDVKKKKFTAMEALVRLHEIDGGFISPGEFIPIAEATGLITNITWFVINEVCHTVMENEWLDDMRISINLSMSNLSDDAFIDALIDRARSCNVDKGRISFEFTERVIRDKLDGAAKNMKKLAKEGFTFYLDDFGVGYSNFNCVLQLPLDTVKLDMSLTRSDDIIREDESLVSILTDLFHDMGLKVVAEGAETDEQVEMLIDSGVDRIQGYYFAKPMPIHRLKEFLEKNSNFNI